MASTGLFRMDVISKERIIPDSPTPHSLKTYKLSIFDQIMPLVYANYVFFYPRNDPEGFNHANNLLVSERTKLLKKSLSKTLTDFFPLAGKFKDNLQIDCNDQGAYYVEMKVNAQLSDFLKKPDYEVVKRLFPFDTISMEMNTATSIFSHIIMVQINIFNCGGIAVGLCASHKMFDGNTYTTFLKAWSANARGDPQRVHPSFVSPLIFPQDPKLVDESTAVPLRSLSLSNQVKLTMRRFVFDASAIAKLMLKAARTTSSERSPSRVVAVTSLLWKCAISASRARWGLNKRSVLWMIMNLRQKSSPPLPWECVGNILWEAVAESLPNDDLNLHSITRHLKNAIAEIDAEFVDGLKGEAGRTKILEQLKWSKEKRNLDGGAEYYVVTSLCNTGINEVDFGWGKPIWSCFSDATDAMRCSTIVLMDSCCGDGIEAWVMLAEPQMDIFERDPELLSFASLDLSPLNKLISRSFL